MFRLIMLLVAIGIVTAPSSDAALARLDYSGQIVGNFNDDGTVYDLPFSGYFLYDTDAADARPEPDNARYDHAVVDGYMQIDGVDYDFNTGGDLVFVVNDSPVFNDIFATLAFFENADGDVIDFGIQLADFSQTIFSSDAWPSVFSLSDFDGYEPGNFNSTFSYFFSLGSGSDLIGTLNSAEFYLVSVPESAAVWLVLIGLVSMVIVRRRIER